MKKFILGFLTAIIVCMATVVYADPVLQDITVQLNKSIKILYNNAEQNMTDANGVKVYPLTYNGTTYVPLRAVSNILGTAVNWNQDAYAVELGTTGAQPVQPIEEKKVTLSNISATLSKSTFDIGDVFLRPYAQVTATYSDGTTKRVYDITTSMDDVISFNKAGNQNIKVTYTEDGITKTTTVVATVNEPKAETIPYDSQRKSLTELDEADVDYEDIEIVKEGNDYYLIGKITNNNKKNDLGGQFILGLTGNSNSYKNESVTIEALKRGKSYELHEKLEPQNDGIAKWHIYTASVVGSFDEDDLEALSLAGKLYGFSPSCKILDDGWREITIKNTAGKNRYYSFKIYFYDIDNCLINTKRESLDLLAGTSGKFKFRIVDCAYAVIEETSAY